MDVEESKSSFHQAANGIKKIADGAIDLFDGASQTWRDLVEMFSSTDIKKQQPDQLDQLEEPEFDSDLE